MNRQLKQVLENIGERYKNDISVDSHVILELNLGKHAEKMGLTEVEKEYRNVTAVVPVKAPGEGMKAMVDGRTFVNYGLLENGVVIPEYVAKEADLAYRTYHAPDSLVRNSLS